VAFFNIGRLDCRTRALFDKLCLRQSLDAQPAWALRRSCKSPMAFTISPSKCSTNIKQAIRKKWPFLILVDWTAGRESRSTNYACGRVWTPSSPGRSAGVVKALWLLQSVPLDLLFWSPSTVGPSRCPCQILNLTT